MPLLRGWDTPWVQTRKAVGSDTCPGLFPLDVPAVGDPAAFLTWLPQRPWGSESRPHGAVGLWA